jgi:S1-C subfamily serine protease
MDNHEQSTNTDSAVEPAHRKAKTGKKIAVVGAIIVACSAGGFGGGWLASSLQSDNRSDTTSTGVTTLERAPESAEITPNEENIAAVVSKVSPSVVSIITTSSGRGGATQGADGYIMTNNHVINGATQVSVIAADGTEYSRVVVVGSDPLNDVAFIKIDGATDLPAAELGNSNVRIGQQVVAIGNALGQFQNTVTSGIVSATGRPLTAATSDGSRSENLTDLIQTDAAINPGNSGGPLVDLSGKVVGINTAIATDANGIGFAIPINSTRGVLAEVLETGKVSRAFMGVRYLDITPQIAVDEKLDSKTGAYVYASGTEAIVPGSPADKAGVKPGDIILKVNDDVIGKNGNMSSILGQYRPGNTVVLTVLRDGKQIELRATLDVYTDV